MLLIIQYEIVQGASFGVLKRRRRDDEYDLDDEGDYNAAPQSPFGDGDYNAATQSPFGDNQSPDPSADDQPPSAPAGQFDDGIDFSDPGESPPSSGLNNEPQQQDDGSQSDYQADYNSQDNQEDALLNAVSNLISEKRSSRGVAPTLPVLDTAAETVATTNALPTSVPQSTAALATDNSETTTALNTSNEDTTSSKPSCFFFC